MPPKALRGKGGIHMLEKVRQWCGRLSREQWGRLAWYAGMAVLLAVLGAASHAYRERLAAPARPAPAESAISVQAEPPRPTPAPAPEPLRWAWPLEGEIIGAYSPDEPVWSGTLMQWQTHPALDIAGAPGEAVYACRDGVVADAYHDRLWGNVIVIDHGDGCVSTYRGLNTLNLVEVGQEVDAGEVISAVAPNVPCESDLPAHIHFEWTSGGEAGDFEEMIGNQE